MPRRTSTPFAGSETSSNPFIRLPDGRRVLLSDIEQARMAGEFGGSGGASREATPRATAGNSAGAGLVNRNLFRQDNQANADFWETGQQNPNRPHEAVSLGEPSASVAAGATIPQYQPTGNQFDNISGNFYGEPIVQVPRGDASFRSAGDLDAEPSLFPQNVASNPFDEWWRSTPVTGSASVDAGVSASDGGSIWSGEDTIGNFGGNRETTDFVSDLSLGPELNADPALLNEGHGYPLDAPPIDETGVNQPPPPGPVGDEWTRTPEDQRFLPESGEPIVQAPRSSGRGGDISSFGTFGNPLSLGAYLNTSLSSMRYGEGVSGGDVTYLGETIRTPGSVEAGVVPPPATGSIQIDPATGRPYDFSDIPEAEYTPTGRAVSPEVRRGELVSGPMSAQAYERATFGGVRSTGYRDTTGSMTFDPRAANLGLMNSQAFGGTPNDNAYSSDEGATRRFGMIGRMNEFGEYEQTGDIDSFYRSNMENYRGLVYGSQNRPRGVPATGRGG